MNYNIADNIEEAKYWIPTKDENNDFSNVTLNKKYRLHYDDVEEEYYIFDDDNIASLIYLCHNGYFIK